MDNDTKAIAPDPLTGQGDARTFGEIDHPIAEQPARSVSFPTLETFGNAKTLMLAINHAHDNHLPLRGVQLALDDQAALTTLVETAFVTRDAISDLLGLTTNGRLFVGLKPEGVLDLPVEVAEVTGNIDESELCARYCEGKIAAIDKAITLGEAPMAQMTCTWEESYQHCGLTLRAMAQEFRMGLHLPTKHMTGRVIPYSEDRSTGVFHEANLRTFFVDVHERNVKAGWWTDINSGEPLKRSIGEMMILMVTELAEAYDAWLELLSDDKLPEFPGIGVELGDLAIRLADFCGALYAGRIIAPEPMAFNPGDAMFREILDIARKYEAIRKTPEACGQPQTADFLPSMDVALMIDRKLAYNATREDHKIENRLKDGGKQT